MRKIFIIILMTWITLTGVGLEVVAGGTSAADPQLQFFENFPGHLGAATFAFSASELVIHAVNIPLSLSFNYPVFLVSVTNSTSARTQSFYFGLYSLTGSTLSLANSAATTINVGASASMYSWFTMATSATQNITPGAWYFALNVSTSGAGGLALYGNSSINPGNAIPGGFLMGHKSNVTNMPASVATSDFDITGSDAIKQAYIIITA